MRKVTHIFSRFWSTDRSLTILLGLLITNIFVLNPLFELGVFRALIILEVLFSLILVSGVMAVAKSRFVTLLVAAFALVTLVFRWANILVPGAGLATLNFLLSLLFLWMLAVVVLFHVFREGPITVHRIMGAVLVYLLLGLTWTLAYQLVVLYEPESFNFGDSQAAEQGDDLRVQLTYFSFVTLTTLGYGDITAVHPVARTLAMLEALIGQLFPAILIARLVSMELYYRKLR